jgi:hypothetical protein
MSWIQAVLAIIKAIPWFQARLDDLMAYYVKQKILAHDKEFTLAMIALIEERNQIPLETVIGSDNAGKPALRRDGIRDRPRG